MYMKKVVIGLSGGVDSSVAAYLLKEQGYDVIGVTMKTWCGDNKQPAGNTGAGVVEDAERVAGILGIPYHVIDFHKEFDKNVIKYFVDEYVCGHTPNPCIVCNRTVKWEALLIKAKEFGAQYIATGHYSNIVKLPNGRYSIKRAAYKDKDQTYVLYNLTQEQLAHTIMPVGGYSKDKIRSIAKELGMSVAEKSDSQEICFIPDNDYAGFIERYIGEKPIPGNFVDIDGNVLGKHKGIINYTVGQRKGLGIALGYPVFVLKICPESNEVILGSNEQVFSSRLVADRVNFMGIEDIDENEKYVAKIRYNHTGAICNIKKLENDRIECIFEEPQRAITPGQAVVFYKEDYIAGGGIIV
ncbi:MAG: tRNA 2-thiouridine(34) synthase MnmA [Lachnospiraceae bacterium]|nr:tRNA 2-thiouridine(34) synthase MnmA [Lachnospiraceae bacterium]